MSVARFCKKVFKILIRTSDSSSTGTMLPNTVVSCRLQKRRQEAFVRLPFATRLWACIARTSPSFRAPITWSEPLLGLCEDPAMPRIIEFCQKGIRAQYTKWAELKIES